MSESDIQKAVVQHLRLRCSPNTYWFHVPNGGRRSITEAVRFKSEGVKAGVPDLIICHRSQFFALELKAEKGVVSPHQRQAHWDIEDAGGFVAVSKGLDQALITLETWGILNRK